MVLIFIEMKTCVSPLLTEALMRSGSRSAYELVMPTSNLNSSRIRNYSLIN